MLRIQFTTKHYSQQFPLIEKFKFTHPKKPMNFISILNGLNFVKILLNRVNHYLTKYYHSKMPYSSFLFVHPNRASSLIFLEIGLIHYSSITFNLEESLNSSCQSISKSLHSKSSFSAAYLPQFHSSDLLMAVSTMNSLLLFLLYFLLHHSKTFCWI